jgi:hypothetical protein
MIVNQLNQEGGMDNPIFQISNPDQDMKLAVQGRWDMTIRTHHGDLAGWMEIRHSGLNTLVGQFVAPMGSARPVARVDVQDGKLHFSVPPQWEEGSSDLTIEGHMHGDRLGGTMMFPDGNCFKWAACRAPSLRRAVAPVWGEPVSLFNGEDLSGWQVQGENTWVVENGVLRNVWTGGNLVTEQVFNDFKLHVEFRYPEEGNSGVYLRGRYEVQILDSPRKDPASDLIGAIYGFLPPSKIVTHGPGEWNAFDITLIGRMVWVEVNGELVICNQEIPGITGGALDSSEGAPGPLLLQGDHGPVDFRNIMITPPK